MSLPTSQNRAGAGRITYEDILLYKNPSVSSTAWYLRIDGEEEETVTFSSYTAVMAFLIKLFANRLADAEGDF